MAAWFKSAGTLSGPGAWTGATGVIAGGMVTKAGPAQEMAHVVTNQARMASFFTTQCNPHGAHLQTRRLLQRRGKVGEDEGGQAQEKKKTHYIRDGGQHDC